MFKLVSQLFSLLTSKQRKRFYILQILVVLMAVMEIAGVASIIPFMALVGDMNQLQQDTIISKIFIYSGISSESEFVFLLGIAVLMMLFISALVSMYTIWTLSMFANKIGAEIADRLYSYYLKQGWLFHATGSSAQLTKKIAVEITRVTSGILMPIMNTNARIVLALFMILGIFVYDPIVATIGFLTFASAYFIIFKIVKYSLQNNGRVISQVTEKRFRLMNEGFGGIKDVLLLGRDGDFIERFDKTGRKLAYSMGSNAALAAVPRYFMELIAFGSMIAMVLYLIGANEGNLGIVLPIISFYALASVKLLPAIQIVYANISRMKANSAAFESIKQDLIDSTLTQSKNLKTKKIFIQPKHHITLKDITFTYPNKAEPTLKQLSMIIPANNVIGIVGSSGSGKSTLIDILLGLIEPQEGHLKVDDKIIDVENCRYWQNSLGFVAQSIFLSEGTIAENVAFGVPKDEINQKQVNQSLNLANLEEFIKGLEKGIHTKVGERGVQLSGGQRQRIGIARALYHQAKVLVFDEATSSLDGITEKMIVKAINEFSGQKTIIMIAHRLKTVEKCDQIFFLDNGKVIDHGKYDELVKKNHKFRRMAKHA